MHTRPVLALAKLSVFNVYRAHAKRVPIAKGVLLARTASTGAVVFTARPIGLRLPGLGCRH